MTELTDLILRQARLKMLEELARQVDGRLSELAMRSVLNAWNIRRDRDWIATQLRKMEQLGAIELLPTGETLVAQITPQGRDHLEERSVIVGILRPHEDY